MTDLLARLIEAQENRCYLCGWEMAHRHWRYAEELSKADWRRRRATLDHIQPQSRYDGPLQFYGAACNECNSLKSDRHPYPCEILFGASMWFVTADVVKRRGRSDEAKMRLYHVEKMRSCAS